MHSIQSERLRLRPIDADADAACMLALLNDPGFVRFIGDRGVRDQAQAREYIALRVLPSYALHGYGMYTVERRSDGAWLGNAGLVRRDGLPGPDIGYALLAAHAGRGTAARRHARCSSTHADTLGCPICTASAMPTTLHRRQSCAAWACSSAD